MLTWGESPLCEIRPHRLRLRLPVEECGFGPRLDFPFIRPNRSARAPLGLPAQPRAHSHGSRRAPERQALPLQVSLEGELVRARIDDRNSGGKLARRLLLLA